jgi:tetratricopeptide (TPR) repeat protein
MAGNPALNTAKVEYLIPPCVEANRFADAAVLAEICAETAQTESRHWNNLGFFRREEGIRLSQVADPEQRARAERTFELSLSAYQRALDLAPDDPTYLNDTAVVLHYYLARDLERAMELYDDAIAKANAKIKAGGLSKEAMELVRTALRDANNNKRALQKILDDRAREAARKAQEEAERKAREEAERRKKEGGEGA